MGATTTRRRRSSASVARGTRERERRLAGPRRGHREEIGVVTGAEQVERGALPGAEGDGAHGTVESGPLGRDDQPRRGMRCRSDTIDRCACDESSVPRSIRSLSHVCHPVPPRRHRLAWRPAHPRRRRPHRGAGSPVRSRRAQRRRQVDAARRSRRCRAARRRAGRGDAAERHGGVARAGARTRRRVGPRPAVPAHRGDRRPGGARRCDRTAGRRDGDVGRTLRPCAPAVARRSVRPTSTPASA